MSGQDAEASEIKVGAEYSLHFSGCSGNQKNLFPVAPQLPTAFSGSHYEAKWHYLLAHRIRENLRGHLGPETILPRYGQVSIHTLSESSDQLVQFSSYFQQDY